MLICKCQQRYLGVTFGCECETEDDCQCVEEVEETEDESWHDSRSMTDKERIEKIKRRRVRKPAPRPEPEVIEDFCEDQAWINRQTNETRLFPTCSERWDKGMERMLNSGNWVPLYQWVQKNGR